MTLTWTIGVDWDADDTYTNENARLQSLSVYRGREYGWSDSGRNPMRYGEVWLYLDNYDRRYDPAYSSGDLYGYILPGRKVRISVSDGSSSWPVFAGWVLDIRPYGRKETIVQCVDGLYYLGVQKCDAAGPTANYPVVSALYDLVNMSDWPVIGASTFPFTFPLTLSVLGLDDNGDEIASFQTTTSDVILTEIENICAAYGGTCYITAGGNFAYRVRYPNAPATWELDQAQCLKEIQTKQPWDVIYNSLSVTGTAGAAQTATDTDSSDEYGVRYMDISGNDYIPDATHANNLVDHLILITPQKRYELSPMIEERPSYQFGRDLCEPVQFSSAYLGLDNLFTVGGIRHEWRAGGGCVTALYMEQSIYDYSDLQTFPFTLPLTLGW